MPNNPPKELITSNVEGLNIRHSMMGGKEKTWHPVKVHAIMGNKILITSPDLDINEKCWIYYNKDYFRIVK